MDNEKKNGNSCKGRKKLMFTYGILQLGSNVISALALVAIALGICSIKKESKVFNNCVEEIINSGSGNADAVRFCNGG